MKKLCIVTGSSGIFATATYTYEEVLKNKDKWKEEFRKENGTDQIVKGGMRDPAYENFCKEIEHFLQETSWKIKN